MKTTIKNMIRTVLAVGILAAAVLLFDSSAYAATVKVTNGPCRIRKDASTSSEPVSSVDNGKVLDVVGEKTASDGYTWYEVVVEGTSTGYIRADLVSTPEGTVKSSDSGSSETKKEETKKEETKTETKTETKSETKKEETKTETKSEPVPAPEVTATDALTATVSADTVTVRESASTKSNKKGSAKSGQEVSISGQATDTEGKVWYQVSFEADGKTNEGFIRSDFLQVTSTTADLEPVEEEPVEEEAPVEEAPAVPQDYECKYEANAEGIEEWFLYDHINGTKQSINNIHAVMEQSQNPVEDNSGEVKTMKIIIIVMAVIILLLIVGIALLLFRLRDSYEEFDDIDDDGYEDDEEEIEEMDEEEEEPSVRGRGRGGRSAGRGRGGRAARDRRSYDDYEDEEEGDEDEEEEPEPEVYTRPRRQSTVEPSSRRADRSEQSWSRKSLMDIDDDMEFEFLDLDN